MKKTVDLSWDQWNAAHKKGTQPAAAQPTGAVAGYTGPAMSPDVISKIKAFQKAQGLPVTGNLDAATLKSARDNPAQVAAAKDAKKADAEQKKKDAEAARQQKAVESAQAVVDKTNQDNKDSADSKAATDKLTAAQEAAKNAANAAKTGKIGSTGQVAVDKNGKATNVVSGDYDKAVSDAKAAVKAQSDAVAQRKRDAAAAAAAARLAAAKAVLAKAGKK